MPTPSTSNLKVRSLHLRVSSPFLNNCYSLYIHTKPPNTPRTRPGYTRCIRTGASSVSDTPAACPQPLMDDSAFNEDCLSMIFYVPPSLTLTSSAPTFVWIHGGSFVVGSASDPGLDGSKLAIQTNSIVAVIQYRLGAVTRFLAPDGTTNLAVKDVVNALTFIQKVVPSFGGSASKVTIAGQSSGGTMIRALLAVPSASSLFRSAVIQSDPMRHRMHASDTTYDILNAEGYIFNYAQDFAPAAGNAQPMRPVFDGSFITSPSIQRTISKSHQAIVNHHCSEEAAYAIYGFQYPNGPINQTTLTNQCVDSFGAKRAAMVLSSPFYQPVPADGRDMRVQLQRIGTDYLWRCSSWTFARNWARNGGSAYVGEYIIGASYPGMKLLIVVCLGIILDFWSCSKCVLLMQFGTTPNPTSKQSTLTDQMQKSGSDNVHPIILGGSGEIAVGACAWVLGG
ncbi:Alpha/Beta hydrolase protein [Cyathus striatus]|nr:Alpha/Beta hydrolase protein [Cyathus striatus]